MPFIETDEENFDEVMSAEFAKGNTVILKFGSMYCDACQLMEFELEEVHDRVDGVSILDIDIGMNEGLGYRFLVEEVPTTLIFKDANSQLLYRTGIMLADDIVDLIVKAR